MTDLTYIVCAHVTDSTKHVTLSAIQSYLRYQPGCEIVVVDNNSPCQSFKDEVTQLGVSLLDGGDNYELGAWKKGMREFKRERYFLIQDSLIQRSTMPESITRSDFRCYSYFEASDEYCPVSRQLLTEFGITIPDKRYGIGGSMMVVHRDVWDRMDINGILTHFNPKNKNDSMACERVTGVLASVLGYDIVECAISDIWVGTGKYFHKTNSNRS